MKPETIEVWAEMTESGNIFAVSWSEAVVNIWKSHGKTVVRLTGELPKKPRKREFIGWVTENCLNSEPSAFYHIRAAKHDGFRKCKVTVEELSE